MRTRCRPRFGAPRPAPRSGDACRQVNEVHAGLIALRQPLLVRPGLRRIVFTNIALSDPSVTLLAELVQWVSRTRDRRLPRGVPT